jgi:hypothetical protein
MYIDFASKPRSSANISFSWYVVYQWIIHSLCRWALLPSAALFFKCIALRRNALNAPKEANTWWSMGRTHVPHVSGVLALAVLDSLLDCPACQSCLHGPSGWLLAATCAAVSCRPRPLTCHLSCRPYHLSPLQDAKRPSCRPAAKKSDHTRASVRNPPCHSATITARADQAHTGRDRCRIIASGLGCIFTQCSQLMLPARCWVGRAN